MTYRYIDIYISFQLKFQSELYWHNWGPIKWKKLIFTVIPGTLIMILKTKYKGSIIFIFSISHMMRCSLKGCVPFPYLGQCLDLKDWSSHDASGAGLPAIPHRRGADNRVFFKFLQFSLHLRAVKILPERQTGRVLVKSQALYSDRYSYELYICFVTLSIKPFWALVSSSVKWANNSDYLKDFYEDQRG